MAAFRGKAVAAENDRILTIPEGEEFRKIDTNAAPITNAQYRWFVHRNNLYRLTGFYYCGAYKNNYTQPRELGSIKPERFGKIKKIKKEQFEVKYKPCADQFYEYFADENILYEVEVIPLLTNFFVDKRFEVLNGYAGKGLAAATPGGILFAADGIHGTIDTVAPRLADITHGTFDAFAPRKGLIKYLCEDSDNFHYLSYSKFRSKRLTPDPTKINIFYEVPAVISPFLLSVKIGNHAIFIDEANVGSQSFVFTEFTRNAGDLIHNVTRERHTWKTAEELDGIRNYFNIPYLIDGVGGRRFAQNIANSRLCANFDSFADNTLAHQIRFIFDKLYERYGKEIQNHYNLYMNSTETIIDHQTTVDQLENHYNQLKVINSAVNVPFEKAFKSISFWVRIYKFMNTVGLTDLNGANNAFIQQNNRGTPPSAGDVKALEPTNIMRHAAMLRIDIGTIFVPLAFTNALVKQHVKIIPFLAKLQTAKAEMDTVNRIYKMTEIVFTETVDGTYHALSTRKQHMSPQELVYAAAALGAKYFPDIFFEVTTNFRVNTFNAANREFKLVRKTDLKLA